MLELLLQILVDLTGCRKPVRLLIALQSLGNKFTPFSVDFSRTEGALIQKNLEPGNYFSLGNWLGASNPRFGRLRDWPLLDRRRCHRRRGKAHIRLRGWSCLGARFFRLSRIRNERRCLRWRGWNRY